MTLALDLGTTTGWAVCASGRPPTAAPCSDGHLYSGRWLLKPTRFESHAFRFIKLRDHLSALRLVFPFQRVYYEEVRRHLGTDAAHAYGGYLATLQSWCEVNDVEYSGVGVGVIKKYWTGRGNADKAAMMLECARRGIEVRDDNEADAVALLHYTYR